mgnify:CR=1 FL=1
MYVERRTDRNAKNYRIASANYSVDESTHVLARNAHTLPEALIVVQVVHTLNNEHIQSTISGGSGDA